MTAKLDKWAPPVIDRSGTWIDGDYVLHWVWRNARQHVVYRVLRANGALTLATWPELQRAARARAETRRAKASKFSHPLYKTWKGLDSKPAQWRGFSGFARFVTDVPPRPSSEHIIGRRRITEEHSASNTIWRKRSDQMGDGGYKMALTKRCRVEGIPFYSLWRGPKGSAQFYNDVGERPSAKHCLCRKDPVLGYVPGNVEWLSPDALNERQREKHKDSPRHHPLYETWRAMKKRCYCTWHPKYKHYGARGIKIHPEWRDDFWRFAHAVGERLSGTSLDRIDNDGDYAPGNVRWADAKTQARNRRKAERRRDVVGCLTELGVAA